MKPKYKLILLGPLFAFQGFRSKRLAKKIEKFSDEDRYPMQWRNDFVLKRGKKFLKFLNIKLDVKGYDNIPRGTALIVANHCSSIDATVTLAALENHGESIDDINMRAVFLGKKELKKNRKFVGYMKILNTFFLDRDNPREALKVLDDIASHAKEHRKHIVIFPEGTRSKNGEIQEFKTGAFRIAKKAFIPIVPITINNTLTATNLSRVGKLVVEVIIHPPLKPLSFISTPHKDIAKRVRTIVAKSFKKAQGTIPSNEAKIA